MILPLPNDSGRRNPIEGVISFDCIEGLSVQGREISTLAVCRIEGAFPSFPQSNWMFRQGFVPRSSSIVYREWSRYISLRRVMEKKTADERAFYSLLARSGRRVGRACSWWLHRSIKSGGRIRLATMIIAATSTSSASSIFLVGTIRFEFLTQAL